MRKLYSDDGIPSQVERSQTPDEDDDAGDYDAGVEKGHNDDAESTTLKLPTILDVAALGGVDTAA